MPAEADSDEDTEDDEQADVEDDDQSFASIDDLEGWTPFIREIDL